MTSERLLARHVLYKCEPHDFAGVREPVKPTAKLRSTPRLRQ